MDKDVEWAIATVFVVGLSLFVWMGGTLSPVKSSTASSAAGPQASEASANSNAASSPSTETFYVPATVNVRSGPSTDDVVVNQLVKGDEIEVAAGNEEWRQITQGPHAGSYVYTPVLSEGRNNADRDQM